MTALYEPDFGTHPICEQRRHTQSRDIDENSGKNLGI